MYGSCSSTRTISLNMPLSCAKKLPDFGPGTSTISAMTYHRTVCTRKTKYLRRAWDQALPAVSRTIHNRCVFQKFTNMNTASGPHKWVLPPYIYHTSGCRPFLRPTTDNLRVFGDSTYRARSFLGCICSCEIMSFF